jgi:hypothetical protein
MKRTGLFSLIVILFFMDVAHVHGADIPTPESFFGHKPGADFKMLRWDKIHEYFQLLGANSDRVIIQELGKTTLENPFIMAIISSPENLAQLDKYKEIAKKLAKGRISAEEANRLAKEGKAIALITASMHATECGPTQMSPELGYTLATADSERVRDILENVIFLFVPSFNPDGNIMVVDWYREQVGTPYEAAGMPWLYHHYVGHDNNRDGFMLTQVETQYVTRILYQDWFPQLLLDMHHMGNSDARLFISPMYDPRNPSLTPLVTREIELTGAYIRTKMEEEGLIGVIHHANWSAWWQAGTFTNAWWHNVVSILFEAAGARLATPIFQTKRDLGGGYSRGLGKMGNYQQMNYPSPWPGGWWRLRDIVDYAYSASMAFLESAARHKETYLEDMFRMARYSIEKGNSESPFAFIVPMDQTDSNTAAKMLNILIANGAEVHRATESFQVENHDYPAGTYVVLMSQPYRPFLKDMLSPQVYPDRRQYPDGPPEFPFDLTGWTLAYQMGVQAVEVTFPFDAELELVEEAAPPAAQAPRGGSFYVLDHGVNDSFVAVNRLLKDGASVSWAQQRFQAGGKSYPPGAIIVSGSGLSGKMSSLVEELQLQIYAGSGNPPRAALKLKPLKLGLYQPWTASIDEGWTRWIFDTWEVPYTTVHDTEIRNGQLERSYDVLVIPSVSPQSIVKGNEEGTVPSQYAGGIGNRGLANLIQFVRSGGTLITFDAASDLVLDYFDVPVVNVAKNLEPEEFFCPGTLLKVHVDNTHPIAYGMDENAILMFSRSPVFELSELEPKATSNPRATTVVSYPNVSPLMSGWILGEEKLFDKTALAEVDYGKGKLILFGFRPQNRAQTHGTFKLLFNSLYYGPAVTSGS